MYAGEEGISGAGTAGGSSSGSQEGYRSPTKISRSQSVSPRNSVMMKSGPLGEHLLPTNSEDENRCSSAQTSPTGITNEEVKVPVPEEEAVCRICLIELTEEKNWLKMECSCRGTLQFMHEECAVKWFSMTGNRTCEVCRQEVLNLPATLRRIQNSSPGEGANQGTRLNSDFSDAVVLIMITAVCYFFVLQQLLVKRMKSHAIIVAAPVSFTLSTLSSILSVTLVHKDYVWTFSACQFLLVCGLLQVFYSILRMQILFAVPFAVVVGMGTSIAVHASCLHLFAWRARRLRVQENEIAA